MFAENCLLNISFTWTLTYPFKKEFMNLKIYEYLSFKVFHDHVARCINDFHEGC